MRVSHPLTPHRSKPRVPAADSAEHAAHHLYEYVGQRPRLRAWLQPLRPCLAECTPAEPGCHQQLCVPGQHQHAVQPRYHPALPMAPSSGSFPRGEAGGSRPGGWGGLAAPTTASGEALKGGGMPHPTLGGQGRAPTGRRHAGHAEGWREPRWASWDLEHSGSGASKLGCPVSLKA